MGFRLTGSLEYKIIDRINGINPLEMMICHALTGKMSDKDISLYFDPNFKQWACNVTFLVKPGKIGEITGIDEVSFFPEVIDALQSYKEGDEIPVSAMGTLQQVILRVRAVVWTKEELFTVMDRIHSVIKVKYVDGINMLLSNFNTKELYFD